MVKNKRIYPKSIIDNCCPADTVKSFSLCPRCEYRARFLENGHGPRHECSTGHCYGCYQYRPTLPFILEKNKDDRKPMFAPHMISARSHAVGVAKIDEHVNAKTIKIGKGKYVTTWIPSQLMTLSQDQLKTLSPEQMAVLIIVTANGVANEMKKSKKKSANFVMVK